MRFRGKISQAKTAISSMVAARIMSRGPKNEPHNGLAVGAIFKNEAPYILEWVAYHRSIGISRFFIADNCSDDGSTELLAALDAAGVIHHIPFPGVPGKAPQLQAYAEIMRRHREDFKWIAFIDADEFLTLTDGSSTILRLISEVDENPSVGAIAVNWAIYGSSHHRAEADGFVIERFGKRSEKEFGANLHYKSIVRSSAWLKCGANPHYFELLPGFKVVHTNGSSVVERENRPGLSSEVIWDRLRLNHYVVKSWSEFMDRKRARGRATTADLRAESFFNSHDKNDVVDPMPAYLVGAAKKEVGELRHILKRVSGKLASVRAPKHLGQKGRAVDSTLLAVARGSLDNAVVDGDYLSVKGWALTDDGSAMPYLVPCLGSYPLKSAVLNRYDRPDVVRQIPEASLQCGFVFSIKLKDIPDFLKNSEVKIVGGRSDVEIKYRVSSSVKPRQKSQNLAYNSPFRGNDFRADIEIFRHKIEVKTILDVGANVGQSVKQFKSWFPDSRIFAVEPVGSTFNELVKNTSGMEGVRCFNIALGDSGIEKVYIENSPLSVDNKVVRGAGADGVEEVRCVSGDQFCLENNIKAIDFLKIDTEGYDLDVLRGFTALLKSNKVCLVQVECGMNIGNKKHVYIEDILMFFKEVGYNFFGIYEQVRELDGKVPLRRANVVMVSGLIT